MQNKYRRKSSSTYERELVELLRKRGIYAMRAGASGAGKVNDADVFSDGGVLFEVKSITPAAKTDGWNWPYYALTVKDRENQPHLKKLCEECGVLFVWAIRTKTPTHEKKESKWRFIPIGRLVTTSRGGVHADPKFGGGTFDEMVIDILMRIDPTDVRIPYRTMCV